jgi:hypothetical protein
LYENFGRISWRAARVSQPSEPADSIPQKNARIAVDLIPYPPMDVVY